MKTYAGIPIANIWLLMLYASDFNLKDTRQAIELLTTQHDVDALLGWFIHDLEHYLQQAQIGYVAKQQALAHIRGKVDLKKTYQQQSLMQGKIYCTYSEVSFNHAAHQSLYLALETLLQQHIAFKSQILRCQRYLQHMGVTQPRVLKLELGQIPVQHKKLQQLLVLAQLLLQFKLPSTDHGRTMWQQPKSDALHWLRLLFEKAMAGFYKKYLDRSWQVFHGAVLKWPADAQHAALPHMQTDIILKQSTGRCILIDTKFTQVFCQGYYRKRDLLKSPHLYQLYTYLRSQEYQGSRFQFTQGMLIYPSLGQDVDINIQLQHYPVGFYTVDLSLDRMQIEQQLLAFITASTHIDYDHIS